MWFRQDPAEKLTGRLDAQDLQMIKDYSKEKSSTPWLIYEEFSHGRYIHGEVVGNKIVVTDYQDRVILDSFLHVFVSGRNPWGTLIATYTYDRNGVLEEQRVRKQFNNGEVEEKSFKYKKGSV